MTDWEKKFEKRPRRTAINIGVSVVTVLAVISLFAMAAGLVTMPFRTATGIIERTANPDNVLANYEWFKRQYQDVKAIDVKITATETQVSSFAASAGSRDKWTFEDKQESARLNGVLLGLQGQRASMVAEYNARTQMTNRNIFRTGDLPDHL